ncbi:uncharacterized protein LOC111243548 isoform X2 [Varroa destructor]|uniref:Uncharacterized protein n=1 Tax=Varroa destructor TaxID=109461 RepID=A0A7M7M939_VARDE|nr:uncharacterized protein LOC111243548 isoform X2 [Varroa destructor]
MPDQHVSLRQSFWRSPRVILILMQIAVVEYLLQLQASRVPTRLFPYVDADDVDGKKAAAVILSSVSSLTYQRPETSRRANAKRDNKGGSTTTPVIYDNVTPSLAAVSLASAWTTPNASLNQGCNCIQRYLSNITTTSIVITTNLKTRIPLPSSNRPIFLTNSSLSPINIVSSNFLSSLGMPCGPLTPTASTVSAITQCRTLRIVAITTATNKNTATIIAPIAGLSNVNKPSNCKAAQYLVLIVIVVEIILVIGTVLG